MRRAAASQSQYATAEGVRAEVIHAVQTMLGRDVTVVDIVVDDVHLDPTTAQQD